MRKKIKELYEHSTLVAKIRYSYLCLLVPFVLFLIFCFYNLWNNNRRYEDMINSSVMASQFSLDFQKDFDYETYRWKSPVCMICWWRQMTSWPVWKN